MRALQRVVIQGGTVTHLNHSPSDGLSLTQIWLTGETSVKGCGWMWLGVAVNPGEVS